MHKPAILGGKATFTVPFQRYNTIGVAEQNAALSVVKSGKLSGFVGADCVEFYGGEKVRELERNWCEYFDVKYAVSMNSATSCLYAAIAALGIEPGDEIIVTSMTMTATVTGILLYQAVPVFVDICPETFCLDPGKLEKLITNKTRAIIGVDLYGYTADWDKIHEIISKYKLFTIEDSAQSIGGSYKGQNSGTLADIGVFSLNRHKHIHCGEGGICVTNNFNLAERLQLIRNHGEAVVAGSGRKDITNIIGFNFRMTEVEAAIAIEQLKKLKALVVQRQAICKKIIEVYSTFPGLLLPVTQFDKKQAGTREELIEHVFYYLCFKIDESELGISRKNFVAALNAEGMPHGEGGYMPVYLLPIYQRKIAFGSKGYPFSANFYPKDLNYCKGICPVAENMWFKELFYFKIQNYFPSVDELDLFHYALSKVYHYRHEIEAKLGEPVC